MTTHSVLGEIVVKKSVRKSIVYSIMITSILCLFLLAGCAQEVPPRQSSDTQQSTDQEPPLKIGDIVSEVLSDKEDSPSSQAPPSVVIDDTKQSNQNKKQSEQSLITKTVVEGDLVSFPNLRAIDPEGDEVSYTFSTPLNNEGEWQTKDGDAGEYKLVITASDGVNKVKQEIRLLVTKRNHVPTIKNFEDITVREGETIILSPIISDKDGDALDITYSGFMTSSTYKTTFQDAGTHFVKLEVSDGTDEIAKSITITVSDKNHKPIIEKINDIKVTELDELVVRASAKDPDGDKVTFSFSSPLDKDGRWKTKAGDAGEYETSVTASDGKDTATTSFNILVKPINNAPEIVPLEDIQVKEGDTINLLVDASDEDGDAIELTFSGFMDSSVKKTTYNDAGIHYVTITASDGKSESQTKVKITVIEVNRPPMFTAGSFS